MSQDQMVDFAKALSEVFGQEEIAYQFNYAKWADGGTYGVLVVGPRDGDFSEGSAEEWLTGLGRMAVWRLRRDQAIAACPGHEWEHEFEAEYLGGALDAFCRCGARRSDLPD